MFEDLILQSINHLEEEFYGKEFYFSYSSLSKLLWNPAVFYQIYVLGYREEKIESHLKEGKLIHLLLLNKEDFDKTYIVSSKELPTGNTESIINEVFRYYSSQDKIPDNLEDCKKKILEVLVSINLHQSLTTDEKRLEKIITSSAKNYWNFLVNSKGKEVISQETLNKCKESVKAIYDNPRACEVMGLHSSEFDNNKIYNEIELRIKLEKYSFGIKGILDNIHIDHSNKTIYINDLKTTSKNLTDFHETVEYYNYWLQAAIYTTLVMMTYSSLIQAGYQFKFNFIVIDPNLMTYVFPVSQKTLETWVDRMGEVLDIANYHYTERKFMLPYKFCKGLVEL